MTASRTELRFLLNDRPVTLPRVSAEETLLDYLRGPERLTGTKEGCAEGDCGACTVLVGRLTDAGLRYLPVNACIRFLAACDGCHIVTIEHLAGADGGLHPVQRAMVDHHGAQCGFCTPGIVMALYALWMEGPAPSRARIAEALQGNLCRCTGYAPIIAAAEAACAEGPGADRLSAERAGVTAQLSAWQDGVRVDLGGAVLPASVEDFAEFYAAHPEATVVAGATDVGLWVTKHLRRIAPALHVGHLSDLAEIRAEPGALVIGAGASYEDARAPMLARWPHLEEYWARIGGWQVRSAGTIGGNIANGSPIGDMPPVLIALGARLRLRHGAARREIALEDFFIEYGQQDRAPGEFVEAVAIPLPEEGEHHAAYKISKRRDEDISAVAMGLWLRCDGERIREARLALGGMAATPVRAAGAEAALTGVAWGEAAFVAAAEALADDVTPLSDWRASAGYRLKVAQNLLRRFWAETENAAPVRLPRSA